jgi:hypothetical protein
MFMDKKNDQEKHQNVPKIHTKVIILHFSLTQITNYDTCTLSRGELQLSRLVIQRNSMLWSYEANILTSIGGWLSMHMLPS